MSDTAISYADPYASIMPPALETVPNPTVYVVDDDNAMCESIHWLLESVDLNVKTYTSAAAFLHADLDFHHGCIILDARMPNMSGLELQQVLGVRGVSIPIIFLTGHGDTPMATQAMKGGAFDFMEKPYNGQSLLDKVHSALAFDRSEQKKRLLINRIKECIKKLTPREKEIMYAVISGKSSKQIAKELGIRDKTVELHRGKIMLKMEVSSSVELATRVSYYELSKRSQQRTKQ